MKYLVKTIKHTTGEEFTDIIKVKNNEDCVIVEAESKEEAEEIAKRPKGLLEIIPSSFNSCRSISKPIPDRKHATPPRVEIGRASCRERV